MSLLFYYYQQLPTLLKNNLSILLMNILIIYGLVLNEKYNCENMLEMLVINTLLWRVEFGIWLLNDTEKFEPNSTLRRRVLILQKKFIFLCSATKEKGFQNDIRASL